MLAPPVVERRADWILARQELAHERFIHERDEWRVFVVTRIKVTTSEEQGLHGSKIAGRDSVNIRQRSVPETRLRLAFQIDRVVETMHRERQTVGQARSLDAGRGTDLVEQAALKLAAALLGVALQAEIEGGSGGV
jgi:IS4 transposase